MVELGEQETQVRVREIPPPTRRGDTGTRGVNKKIEMAMGTLRH